MAYIIEKKNGILEITKKDNFTKITNTYICKIDKEKGSIKIDIKTESGSIHYFAEIPVFLLAEIYENFILTADRSSPSKWR